MDFVSIEATYAKLKEERYPAGRGVFGPRRRPPSASATHPAGRRERKGARASAEPVSGNRDPATVTTTASDQPALVRVVEQVSGASPVILRLTAAYLWLSNLGWKLPPDFGRSDGRCRGLCGFVQAGVDHPVLPPFSWLLEHAVSPHLAAFGYLTLGIEFSLAVLLLSGTLTRGTAVLGFVQSAFIGMSVANAPNEWYWSYALMAALHIAVFATAGGRRMGVDALLRQRHPRPTWLEALT